jgi:putative nucleotidyltransferase with HDIG domain
MPTTVTPENDTVEEVEISSLTQVLETSYPLLQQLREKAPGTFKHSQALSGMVEGVALSLGLDVTRMKVAAHYHDIGKIFNPKYFSENQLEDENPHEKMEPRISYQYISRHVSDGALILLQDQNFPRDLIRIICQHHGTSIVKYFFKKSGTTVEDPYRYKGEKPKSVEALILMVCDCIEATSRALIQAGKFNPKEIIENTIISLLSDGQLDEVIMRLGDLQKIKEALAKELEGTYQKRVDYSKAQKDESENSKKPV